MISFLSMADQAHLQAEIDLGKSKISGLVLDITDSSARVRVRESIPGGARVGLRLYRPSTGVSKEVAAYVVWHRPLAGGDTDLGLKLSALHAQPIIGRSRRPASGTSARARGQTVVELRGDFTESVDFHPLAEALATTSGPIEMDASYVRRINSVGAVHWIDFVHGLRGRPPSRFLSCSARVHQSHTAMSTGMVGHELVVSVMAPYLCARCGESVTCLIEIAALRKSGKLTPPMLEHEGCGGVLEFDDLPERYFSFLE